MAVRGVAGQKVDARHTSKTQKCAEYSARQDSTAGAVAAQHAVETTSGRSQRAISSSVVIHALSSCRVCLSLQVELCRGACNTLL